MNIKTFVEETGKEFDEKFPVETSQEVLHWSQKVKRIEIKSFMSSKLRELIGEVRREIIEWVSTNESCNKLDADMVERYVNSLLDEAGGK